MNECTIGVECQTTNPPRPTNFLIKKDGLVVAWLTYEQIQEAVARFDKLKLDPRSDASRIRAAYPVCAVCGYHHGEPKCDPVDGPASGAHAREGMAAPIGLPSGESTLVRIDPETMIVPGPAMRESSTNDRVAKLERLVYMLNRRLEEVEQHPALSIPPLADSSEGKL